MIVAAKRKEKQERTCAVTRTAMDPAALIRFVAAPDGNIVPDLRRKLPGRGVWVTATADSVSVAVKRRVFAKSLKCDVRAEPELANLVDQLLLDDARQSLSLANKAGLAASGATQAEKLIARKNIAALLHASDGGADGARKMGQILFRHLGESSKSVLKIEIFDSAQLGLALGQLSVIHAALKRGSATDAFLTRCRRLAVYRGVALEEHVGEELAGADQGSAGASNPHAKLDSRG